MQMRKLGTTDITIKAVGLGCMGFSHAYGEPTERGEAERMIRAAHDMGYDFFDTAECYTGINPDGSTSYNEELVGEALASVRDEVVIATKFGVTHGPNGLICDSSPERIRSSIEGSLRRLGLDYVDLYYQHRIDPKVEPEVVAGVMGELIAEGKIGHWGISETTEEYLRRAHAVTPVTAIQNRYSMLAREHEPIFDVCEELGVTYVAFSPLGNGFLTGAYKPGDAFAEGVDFRSRMPQYTEEGFAAAAELMELLESMSAEHGCTKGQLSLAWMICKKPFIVPIPGSRKEHRLRENLGAAEVVLSSDEIDRIDALLDRMELLVYGQGKK